MDEFTKPDVAPKPEPVDYSGGRAGLERDAALIGVSGDALLRWRAFIRKLDQPPNRNK